MGEGRKPRVLIVEDDFIVGRELRGIVADLGLDVVGPLPGVKPALAVIGGVRLDAALLAVRVDDGLSFPVAEALDAEGVPYAFVTAVKHMVEQDPRFADRPLVAKPHRRADVIGALKECCDIDLGSC